MRWQGAFPWNAAHLRGHHLQDAVEPNTLLVEIFVIFPGRLFPGPCPSPHVKAHPGTLYAGRSPPLLTALPNVLVIRERALLSDHLDLLSRLTQVLLILKFLCLAINILKRFRFRFWP